MSARLQVKLAVYMILEKEDKILLMRRFNTGWEDGKYTLPAAVLASYKSGKTFSSI